MAFRHDLTIFSLAQLDTFAEVFRASHAGVNEEGVRHKDIWSPNAG